MKWAVGMHAQPDPRWTNLYQRALICRTFPAYRLEELRDSPAGAELMQAMQLLETARKALS